ncbi:MAG TPA: AprI/Inh family metalloprotease inhibitor [Hyphomicrobium sp.]|nr:AprI/Inh family metalloprotease inhibitor [Hyphomicrobium sp.]
MPSFFRFYLAAFLLAFASPLAAQELKPMDTSTVNPELLEDMYGTWEVSDAEGAKRCEVTLKKEPTIGGNEIEVAEDCAKTFPVMDDITAWRLYEGWTIGFADATRKLRIHFFTPDERYVAEPEVDGISTIAKK